MKAVETIIIEDIMECIDQTGKTPTVDEVLKAEKEKFGYKKLVENECAAICDINALIIRAKKKYARKCA